MEMTVKRGRAGWRQEETTQLFTAVQEASHQGRPLRTVFEALSHDLGRKPNSIRNYYYACLHQQPDAQAMRPSSFTLFTPEETHEVLRQVLLARGQGRSVRSGVMEMAGGDRSLMLRYQKMYRSMLRTRPDMIAAVRAELQAEGLPCPGEDEQPRHDRADPTFLDPDDPAASRLMAQPCVAAMLEGLKELLRRAAQAEAAKDQQLLIARLQVQHDLRRMAWERDYDSAVGCLARMAASVRGLLELPQEEQCAGLERFRDEVSEALTESERYLVHGGGEA